MQNWGNTIFKELPSPKSMSVPLKQVLNKLHGLELLGQNVHGQYAL